MGDFEREVKEAPKEIVSEGQCNWGTFNGVIEKINPLDAIHPLGFPTPRFFKDFRLKEWEALQISNGQWFICAAVYNTKSLGTAIVMAYNRADEKLYRYEKKVTRSHLHVASGLGDSLTWYKDKNLFLKIHNNFDKGDLHFSFSAKGFKGLLSMEGEFSAVQEREPIVIVQPFGKNRPLYSHKSLQSCQGKINMEGQEIDFPIERSTLIVDDHKGYYPYTMKYDWCTTCTVDDKGEPFGFNLTDNQILEPEKFNENCLWLGGKMYPLPPVHFERSEGLMGVWHICDSEGIVDICFTPKEDVPNRIELGLIRIDYHGVFGDVNGFISTPSGEKISFEKSPSMGEKKFIRI